MKVKNVRHQWPEGAGFLIERQNGAGDYVFLHFHTPVELRCGKEKIITMPGAFIIYSPETPQWFYSPQPVVHDWAHVAGRVGKVMSSYGIKPDAIYYPADTYKMTALFKEIEWEFMSEQPFSEGLIELKLIEMFIYLSRNILYEGNGITVSVRLRDECRKLRIEMFSHLEKKLPIHEMAAAVHLSPSRFYAVYKHIFGIPPNKDLILARMEKAKHLLLSRRYTNAQVAALTGYRNEFHFIRQFKKYTGMPPQKYVNEVDSPR